MAHLEYIEFRPWRELISADKVAWEPDAVSPSLSKLPQIFWSSGESWSEVNQWALTKLTEDQVDAETVVSLIKHLRAYADFLERGELDWRHFPVRVADRVLVKFRGELIKDIKSGTIASRTASARMSAVIQFYRHANLHGFVAPHSPMWRERTVVFPFFDAAGFQRTLVRQSTNLAIPSRPPPGVRLEDGLLPISEQHMEQLLAYTRLKVTRELHLFLAVGFFVGARFETVAGLRITDLEKALPDSWLPGFHRLLVGPKVGVPTKFDRDGFVYVPNFLLDELKDYAYSVPRLKREAKAARSDKARLFLTVRGRPYVGASFTTLMTGLRRECVRDGLKFMARFKFHQTRATYGTWAMQILLSVTSVANAIGFVKEAMLHKNESTTLGYVNFLEHSKGKEKVAEEFSRVFTGLQSRNWDDFDA